MANGLIVMGKRFVDSEVTIPYTVGGNSYAAYNLKQKIDADMPSGAEFFMITGFRAVRGEICTNALRYDGTTTNGLVLRNLSSSSISDTYYVNYKYII